MTAPLDPNQASATLILQNQLTQWGLGVLTPLVSDLIRQNLGSDAITLQLQQSPEYKARFAANDARVKAGLPALTPAEYISTEASYRQVMAQYGLPAGFYDNQQSLSELIAKDISPDELKQRATDAQQVWLSTDPSTKAAWRQMYGLSDGAAIASILDPNTALSVVNRESNAALIGGSAIRNGLQANRQNDELYADLGITGDQANKAYGQIGATWDQVQQMATRFGTSFTQQDAEQANLTGQGPGVLKQTQLFDAEKALFSQRGSADQNTESSRTSGSY